MTDHVLLHPVARVIGGRPEMYEDDWYDTTAVIRLDERFEPDALQGLAEFSHLEVVFWFDRIDEADVQTRPRAPRKNPDGPLVGVFAHRGPYRPNRLGVSVCRLVAVDGRDLRVAGLDALDGTPVLDIKPYLVEFAPAEPVRQPAWATRLMRGYYRA
ncbi:tRNA (N6-threonylcarbamoyladenosine(37)-N6)-methyltransferase TrmO [Sphaerisporangium rufum]|uniref:tRNA (N6-threonylcarbamoyladenosine(37)-N6)-methyltransferase TrmO n=1 Tax=Sphaerisporangium rufum TaxID=1381558 RepID=A0A919V4E9_9ACTN|nr:tRNA (N6-threonylcarbamoyladenosine(37)-N6)-methyltransferase TrmO [Sphaerisporangium rufum]GII81882.1 tRNA (N6-threonylcarbamoyladenosine(37)-N6)-methyltransferase TrmO [Sphaerisporangium rufum]